MNDVAATAFRISDDYIKRPDRCEHPILLGFTKEERVWTNQERTPEELVDFVMEDRTRQLILYTAIYSNRIGYSGFECTGTIKKDQGKYWFQADLEGFQGSTEDDTKFDLPDNGNEEVYEPMIRDSAENPECLRAFVVTIEREDESGYYVILRTYHDLSKEEAEARFHREMYLDLIRTAGIHSYKQLGKFMNQSQMQFVADLQGKS